MDGFPADVGLYYELASRLPHQAVLTGSGTMLAAAASEGIDLLVIVDGQGNRQRAWRTRTWSPGCTRIGW
jgi:hypothetical protein